MPASFDRFDMVAMGAAAGALAAWLAVTALPVIAPFAAALMVAAGVMQAIRLGRWAGERTFAEPLVTVLHVGFAFVPLGFLLIATGLVLQDAAWRSAGIHAWTTGAIGLMTLAVMTRATRGHTARTSPPPLDGRDLWALSRRGAGPHLRLPHPRRRSGPAGLAGAPGSPPLPSSSPPMAPYWSSRGSDRIPAFF